MTRQDSPEGAVLHADVRFGDVVLMVATADAPYEAPPLHGVSTGGGLYLWMPEAADVDDWHARHVLARQHLVAGLRESCPRNAKG